MRLQTCAKRVRSPADRCRYSWRFASSPQPRAVPAGPCAFLAPPRHPFRACDDWAIICGPRLSRRPGAGAERAWSREPLVGFPGCRSRIRRTCKCGKSPGRFAATRGEPRGAARGRCSPASAPPCRRQRCRDGGHPVSGSSRLTAGTSWLAACRTNNIPPHGPFDWTRRWSRTVRESGRHACAQSWRGAVGGGGEFTERLDRPRRAPAAVGTRFVHV